MRINRKMGILSASSILSIGLVVVFVGYTLSMLRTEFQGYQNEGTIVRDLIEIKATALSVAKDDPILPDTATALKAADDRIQHLMEEVGALIKTDEMKQGLQDVSDYWSDYLRQFESAIKIASDSPEDALQIPDVIYQMYLQPMVETLNQRVDAALTQENGSTSAINLAMKKIFGVVIIPMVLCGLVVFIGQTLFARSLKRRVSRVQVVAAQLESGDLTKRLPEEGKDEISEISQAVNHFVSQVHDILRSLVDSADGVSAAASKLFTASEEISKSSVSQSDAASAVAATVEQLSINIGQVADHARNAHIITVESEEALLQGTEVVMRASKEMNRISQSVSESSQLVTDLELRSADITDIISVIKDVADQTNLLALNAAIEAARAGDMGRGFAVVADEVRNLAQRTTQSTEQITDVITQIQGLTKRAAGSMGAGVGRVESGVALTSQASESIGRVREGSQRIVQVVDNISTALQEQSAASEDISQQMERIAAISQNNVGSVGRTVGTAKELEKLAFSLERSVKQFVI